jgi:voltage-gated potassium channel
LFSFLLISIFCTFKQVVFDTEISTNRLVGAVCIYLLLGVIWAVAYSILEMTFPGSFQGFLPLEDREWDSEWLYLSFVTMTTLGYGDISPVSAIARALAYIQAIFGQFYIAILVAGLVGAHIFDRLSRKTGE